MEDILSILKEINIAHLAVMGFMMWMGYRRLESKMEKMDNKIEKLTDRVNDLDRSMCRIQGNLETQGHCLFHQGQQEKKAE